MDKRFQVFISSTYSDLIDERREVMQAVLELNHIPAGMELFTAGTEEAWHLIRQVIEQSDYYVLVLGGRYGSVDKAGVSFTEREYDLAVEVKIPVLAFVHESPDDIPHGKTDKSETALTKLSEFRRKVESRHLRRTWRSPSDLGGSVSRSLVQEINRNPRIGWIRADRAIDPKVETELAQMRRERDELLAQLKSARLEPPKGSEEFANGAEKVPYAFQYSAYEHGEAVREAQRRRDGLHAVKRLVTRPLGLTWDELFCIVGPMMIVDQAEGAIHGAINSELQTRAQLNATDLDFEATGQNVSASTFQAIKVQFMALGLIEPNLAQSQPGGPIWRLTPYGSNYLVRVLAKKL